MLALLITCVVALIVAGVAIWLLGFLTIDAKIFALIRGLIILFAVLFVIVQLYNGRAVFSLR